MAEASARRAIAVEAAREVFWSRGYDEASIAEIVEASGLNRYALYAEFGGKRELFLACLDHFFEQQARKYKPAMFDPSRPPLERVRAVFDLAVEEMISDSRGCLMCQTAVEVARQDPSIAGAVSKYFGLILEFFAIPMREEAAAGRLNPNLSPETAAQLLFDAHLSLGVYARAGAPRDQLERILEITLAALQGPPRAEPAQSEQDAHKAARG